MKIFSFDKIGMFVLASALLAFPAFAHTTVVPPAGVAWQMQQGHAQEQSQTFTGKIVMTKSGYALQDTNGKTWLLDDQDKAKQFEGKSVTITGTLDSSTGMIHVADIQPAD